MQRACSFLIVLALVAIPELIAAQKDSTGPAEAPATQAWTPGDTPKVGEKFPPFAGKTHDGRLVALEDYRGKVVLLDFWATWCGPCLAELPNVREVYAAYHDKGFEILAISLDKEGDALKNFYENEDTTLPWPSIYDGKGWDAELADRFGIKAIPAMFLLDKEGTVVATDTRGAKLWREVAQRVDPGGAVPPDLTEEIQKYIDSKDPEERARIAALVAPWIPRFQAEINAIVWTLVDENDISREDAAYALSLMQPTIEEGKDFMSLDTAALAAYYAGQYQQAAKLQQIALDKYLAGARRAMPNKDEAELYVAVMHRAPDSCARLALYQATIGDVDAARKNLQTANAAPEKARIGAIKYLKMAEAALAAAENAKRE